MSQSTLHKENPGGLPLKTRLTYGSLVALRASKRWLQVLDQVLRGETTHPSALREQSLRIPLVGLSLLLLGLALFYGFCMGMYPGCRTDDPSTLRWLACTLKIPALFLLTLCVTFPSLYVVNALVGSRLRLLAVLQLLVAALGVNVAVLASAGPIVAFFSFSTTNCPFMVLLNVLVFTVSGLLGMAFLLRTLQRMSAIPKAARLVEWRQAAPRTRQESNPYFSERWTSGSGHFLRDGPEGPPCKADQLVPGQVPDGPSETDPQPATWSAEAAVLEPEERPCALDPLEGHVLDQHVKTVFCCWTVIFGVVGAQMAWVLRPYFGSPGEPFVWFGPRTSNFFEGVWVALRQLLS